MRRHFTIATGATTPKQDSDLAEAWKQYGWWHWIPNFWLLVDQTGAVDAVLLRDQIKRIAPQATAIVIEVAPTAWAGLFPELGPQRDWLRNTWPPEANAL